jgi:hypothetical protein
MPLSRSGAARYADELHLRCLGNSAMSGSWKSVGNWMQNWKQSCRPQAARNAPTRLQAQPRAPSRAWRPLANGGCIGAVLARCRGGMDKGNELGSFRPTIITRQVIEIPAYPRALIAWFQIVGAPPSTGRVSSPPTFGRLDRKNSNPRSRAEMPLPRPPSPAG